MNKEEQLLSHMRLKFNIQHPNLEDAYIEGFEAALEEMSEDVNPYPADSTVASQWSEGWWAGFYGEEPIYEYQPSTSAEVESITATVTEVETKPAANSSKWTTPGVKRWAKHAMRIAGALAATAVVGYQLIDLVA